MFCSIWKICFNCLVNKGYVFLFICTGLFLSILYISLCYKCMWIFSVAAHHEQNALTPPPSRGFTREWRHLFYYLFSLCARLRVIPLSLSPSCVTRKKLLLGPRSQAGIFFLAIFFRVMHGGLSERGTTRSLLGCTSMHFFYHWSISLGGSSPELFRVGGRHQSLHLFNV